MRVSYYSIASLSLYGFCGTEASLNGEAKTIIFFSCIGTFLAGIISYFILNSNHPSPLITANWRLISFSLVTGVAYGFGTLFFIQALKTSSPVSVITITSIYPTVSLILCWLLLNININYKQMLGIGLGLIAVILLSQGN